MNKPIPNFSNYTINSKGEIFNSRGIKIKQREFKNTKIIRLYKNGKRHNISVNKLLFSEFNLVDKLLVFDNDEEGIRYKDTHYFLTNKCRCYNAKTKLFLKPVYRNNYPTFNLYTSKGKREVVYALSFLTNYFKNESELY